MSIDCNETAFTREQLSRDLRALGLSPGDIVYVHSSLKSIGPIEGGAETLVDSFLDVLGAKGTLGVPTHTLHFKGLIPTPYDASNSPSHVGAFTEVVRKHPAAFRSGHATHSSSAIGHKAEWLTANHMQENPVGYDSPIHRMYRENGKVLLLGVSQSTNTMLHLAEYLSGVPYMKVPFNAAWGPTTHFIENGEVKTAETIEYMGCSAAFPLIEGILKRAGQIQYGKVGKANCQLMSAQTLVDQAIEIIREVPDFFLCHRDYCTCCPPRHAFMHSLKSWPQR